MNFFKRSHSTKKEALIVKITVQKYTEGIPIRLENDLFRDSKHKKQSLNFVFHFTFFEKNISAEKPKRPRKLAKLVLQADIIYESEGVTL